MKSQGKKNREAGQRFELKVRKDLESKRWIVDRWSNNVDLDKYEGVPDFIGSKEVVTITPPQPKLIPAKSRFGLRTTGFPDFICFKLIFIDNKEERLGEFKKLNKQMDFTSKYRPRKYKKLCENLQKILNRIKSKYKDKNHYELIGVECKSNGYLDKEEKAKCKWLLANHIFSKILIAKKGKKRGQIEYVEL